MRNLKIILAYDGADFSGWQVQPARSTIQGLLAAALERLTGERVLPQGSGRTDAGVHALAQVASCGINSPIPDANLLIALNDLLPPAIRITAVETVPADFHARASARRKTYRYRLYRGAVCPPFLARYVCHHPWPLDETAMIAAAPLVEGEHDFTSFAAVDPERLERLASVRHPVESANVWHKGGGHAERSEASAVPNQTDCTPAGLNVRTIHASSFARQGDELIYTVTGSGFLQHMVRNLVGTFLLVGKGTLQPSDIPTILAARSRSSNPGATAPASGLYLVQVEY
jgi:tRNA pseudouridine38-40 synthase